MILCIQMSNVNNEVEDTTLNIQTNPVPGYKTKITAASKILTNTNKCSYTVEVGQQAKSIVQNRYPIDGKMNNAVDLLILIASMGALMVSILNYIKIITVPLRNIISHFTLEDIKERKRVELLLSDFIKISGCNRVCVGLFHNGTSLGKYHFRKMSITHEALDSKITKSLRSVFKEVELEKIEEEIVRSNSYSFTKFSRNDEDIEDGCKTYLESTGIDTVLSRLLVSSKGIYGIIELHFTEHPDSNILADKMKAVQMDFVYEEVCAMLKYVTSNKKIPRKLASKYDV